MEFNWSTFILEIINFIVLVWILKRLFYMPIQKAILKRKQAIQESMDKAQKLYDESNQLREKYENRLHDWEKEKEQKMKSLQEELENTKTKELLSFEKKLDEEREKMRARELRAITSIIEKNVTEALLLAFKFSSKFLKKLADRHLEEKIIENFLTDFSEISIEKIQLLKNGMLSDEDTVTIQSAYLIDEIQKKHLIETLRKLLNSSMNITFTQNSELLAGLNIKIGAVFLQANLRDELKFFAEVEHGSSRKQ